MASDLHVTITLQHCRAVFNYCSKTLDSDVYPKLCDDKLYFNQQRRDYLTRIHINYKEILHNIFRLVG